MPDLPFLAAEGLTTKDKLVLLTAHVLDSAHPDDVAGALSMSVASVKQSLAKGGEVDDAAEAVLQRSVSDAIVEVCQMDRRSMRSQDWRLVAKVAASISATGADPDEVRVRARNLRLRFRLPVTPGSLDKYWPQLADRTPFSPAKVYGQ